MTCLFQLRSSCPECVWQDGKEKPITLMYKKNRKLFILGIKSMSSDQRLTVPFEAGSTPFKKGWMAKKEEISELADSIKQDGLFLGYLVMILPKRGRWQCQEVSVRERLLVAMSTVLFDLRSKSGSVLQGLYINLLLTNSTSCVVPKALCAVALVLRICANIHWHKCEANLVKQRLLILRLMENKTSLGSSVS